MAEISKVKLPNNEVYDIAVYTNHIKPIKTKTYTDVIGTAASWAGASWAYARIKPDNFFVPWKVTVKVTAESAGSNYSKASSTFTLDGVQDTYMSYSAQNVIQNTSYRPIYYHMYYRFKQAAIDDGGTHALGFSFLYSWNYTTAANKRTITVELMEATNCEFTFLDTLEGHSTVVAESNYNTYTNFDFASNGLQETGDSNDVNYYNRSNYASRTTKNALYRYQLCVTDSTGQVIPINSVNNSVATNKTLMTDSFDPFGEIFYWNSTGTAAAGANVGNSYWYRQYLADLRYSFNCGGYNVTSTLTARLPLYLVVAPQTDGSVKLHSDPLAQTLPTADNGLLYIYLGRVYEDTKPYRVVLTFNHPIYWYKDGAVRQYTVSFASTSVHGITKLNTATNSTSTTEAATPSAVKTAKDRADEAYSKAATVESGLNGSIIYDQTFTISSGVASFTPHVYLKGEEVTSNYATSCFTWKYRLIDGSEVTLATKTDRGCDVTISSMGYGGHVIGVFTPPE